MTDVIESMASLMSSTQMVTLICGPICVYYMVRAHMTRLNYEVILITPRLTYYLMRG